MSAGTFTPGPWSVANGTDIFGPLGGESASGVRAEEKDAWQVADCNMGATFVAGELRELSYAERKANAARIVQCVNSHDELVRAAKAVAFSNGFDAALPEKMEALRVAIAQSEGRA